MKGRGELLGLFLSASPGIAPSFTPRNSPSRPDLYRTPGTVSRKALPVLHLSVLATEYLRLFTREGTPDRTETLAWGAHVIDNCR